MLRSYCCAGSYLLRHAWNAVGQRQILADLVDPVVDAWVAEHPESAIVSAAPVSLEALAQEFALVEAAVGRGGPATDTQILSQIKNANDVRDALLEDPRPAARELLQRVDALLDGLFSSSRLSDI